MTPKEYYNEHAQRGLIAPDEQQLVLINKLQETYQALVNEHKKRSRPYNILRRPKTVHGNYIWGGVGVGKTFVMDCFYHSLPFTNKIRLHFHHFMRDVHTSLSEYQGEKNPFQAVAKSLAEKAMVICLDELIVTDITDAMILCRLFHALVNYGVCLIMTSNIKPDELYKNGLQRISFLPAIDLIKRVASIHHIVTPIDYRLRHLKKSGVFHVPNDEIAEEEMEKCFTMLSDGCLPNNDPISICHRQIPIRKQAGNNVWFDFKAICSPPRSPHDYLAIAAQYNTIFISNIPRIAEERKDLISLFIRMIDVFYDAKVRLICSACASVEQLYTEGSMLADYQRTQSRLIEMQSAVIPQSSSR